MTPGPQNATSPRNAAHARAALLGALALMVIAVLMRPATASADEGSKIIYRCAHGQSIGGFPERAYARALQEIPTEVSEYHSECVELIRQAEIAAAGTRGRSPHGTNRGAAGGGPASNGGAGGQGKPGATAPSTSGASTGSPGEAGTATGQAGASASEAIGNQAIAKTPAEQSAISAASAHGGGTVRLGRGPVRPGVVQANVSSAVSSLPTPLLVVIAVLVAALLAVGGREVAIHLRDAGYGP